MDNTSKGRLGNMHLWTTNVTLGCLAMVMAWSVAPVLVTVALLTGEAAFGQYGIIITAAAVTMTVIRDNHRTRRMIHANERRREGKSVPVSYLH